MFFAQSTINCFENFFDKKAQIGREKVEGEKKGTFSTGKKLWGLKYSSIMQLVACQKEITIKKKGGGKKSTR